MENNDRTALIERLRDATEGPRMLMGEAADMLEADVTETNFGNMPAVPQEPVAWQHRGRPAVNREWGDWHTVGYKPKGPECTRFMMRPLFAAPQQRPRLTDAEIKAIEHETDMKSSIGDWSNYFARAIEAKVRGEA